MLVDRGAAEIERRIVLHNNKALFPLPLRRYVSIRASRDNSSRATQRGGCDLCLGWHTTLEMTVADTTREPGVYGDLTIITRA